jgi:integrase
MAFRMSSLTRTNTGAFKGRIYIPNDVKDDYQALYGVRSEELFHAPADCPASRAKVLHSEWEARIKTQIEALRAKQRGEGHDLTQRQARALAGDWYRWFVGQHEENPGKYSHWDALRETLSDLLIDVASDPETGEIDMEAPEVRTEIHPRLADEAKTAQFLASKGEVLTPTAMGMFLDALLGEFLTATDLLRRRAAGDYSPDPHLQTLPAYQRAKSPAVPQSGVTAMQLFESYIRACNLAEGSVGRQRVVFSTLDKYLAGRGFDTLSDDEAQQWVAALVTKGRSASTVKKTWVSALKAAGTWAVKQRHMARNPFADCSVRIPKKTRHRETKAFSTDEILLILSSASAIKNTRRPTMAARRWVPWICAYTGARAGEITQLRGQDVIEPDGIKALRITPDAGSVKTRQARTVPAHEHLIEQGFLDYVKARGKGPLFYNLAPTAATTVSAGRDDITNPKRSPAVHVRSHLGEWVRSIGVTDTEVSPTHGWRHSFKQIADRNGITDRVSDAITGHAPPTEGRAYGAPTLEDMANALKLFPRYKIDLDGSETDASRAINPSQPPAAPNSPKGLKGTEGEAER